MNCKILSVDGSSLALDIAQVLAPKTWQEIYSVLKVDTFSDGEISPQFQESIRGRKVFLVSSTTTPEKIMTLLLTIDAAKRASAEEIILVMPYFGYSRQDRKEGRRGAIGAKLMADLLQTAGADRLVTIDLHSEQIQGFFDIPVNMIPGHIAFKPFISSLSNDCYYCVCSPDAGGVKRASRFYQRFLDRFPDANFAMLSKLRDKPNSIERMDLIGDVKGRHVIIIDDMVDTGGTLLKAVQVLRENGACQVTAVITHGVLSGDGVKRLDAQENGLSKLVITDSIPHSNEFFKIHEVSCAKTIAKAIEAIVHSYSLDQHIEQH
jgi:ribose-phosphate pyrophosphokinase